MSEYAHHHHCHRLLLLLLLLLVPSPPSHSFSQPAQPLTHSMTESTGTSGSGPMK
jgi:hypothetical protein